MNSNLSTFSLDEHDRTPPTLIHHHTAACGRRTTISLEDGTTLDIGPGLRVVAFLMSRFAEDASLSDLAVAAAVCRDDGTLVHRLDDLLVGLPLAACFGRTADPEAPWHRTLQMALQNVDVVVTPGAWARRQAVEAVHGGFSILDWGCTSEDIDWGRLRLPAKRFAKIRLRLGELQRGRRVLDECHLLLEVLTQPSRPGYGLPLAHLLAAVDAEAVRLFAGDVPAVHMPALLDHGYRWSPGQNGAPKGFFIDRKQHAVGRERRFLARLLACDETDLLERSLPASARYRLP